VTFERSDPDWTFDDSWQDAESEPPSAVPCPCCNGNGHEGTCGTAIDIVHARLAFLLHREPPEGWTESAAASHVPDPRSEEPTLSCLRCGDAGVVGVEE